VRRGYADRALLSLQPFCSRARSIRQRPVPRREGGASWSVSGALPDVVDSPPSTRRATLRVEAQQRRGQRHLARRPPGRSVRSVRDMMVTNFCFGCAICARRCDAVRDGVRLVSFEVASALAAAPYLTLRLEQLLHHDRVHPGPVESALAPCSARRWRNRTSPTAPCRALRSAERTLVVAVPSPVLAGHSTSRASGLAHGPFRDVLRFRSRIRPATSDPTPPDPSRSQRPARCRCERDHGATHNIGVPERTVFRERGRRSRQAR